MQRKLYFVRLGGLARQSRQFTISDQDEPVVGGRPTHDATPTPGNSDHVLR